MKRRGWLAIAAVLVLYGLLFSTGTPFADQAAKGVYQLDAMVVSTTRTEIPVFDAPQSVTVIGAEEIAALPFERVEDIVRSVAGAYNLIGCSPPRCCPMAPPASSTSWRMWKKWTYTAKYPLFLSTTGSDTTSPGIIVSGGVKFDF